MLSIQLKKIEKNHETNQNQVKEGEHQISKQIN